MQNDEPKSGQLLIQIKANALCGSERRQFYDGTSVVPGHEAAGVVVAAGPRTRTASGTSGVIYLMDFCGECWSCRLGFTNQCLAKRGDVGFNKDGGYAPYTLVSETSFFPIPSDVPYSEATLLLDIMGTGGHALERARLVRPDIQSLLIAGAGPIGLGVLAMARLLLNDVPVFVTDFVPYRLELAESLGGIPVKLDEVPLAEALSGHGHITVDVAVDTSGKTAARQACLQALSHRGVLVCAGHGEGLQLNVSADLIVFERAVLGTEYFPYRDLDANLERLRLHQSYLSPIITHRYGAGELEQAFNQFFAGETGKVVVER